ncbi:MAG TPA: UDP-N-acetylglucosamine--N-acetylmuramyl-(pentapeptide) pyrophosphoryl-undecaprenol N-acetylglucosamine transferase [Gemmatimonadaceae bacterium]|nr:UDP-N-acetylglucosamine--N-acetylmuramyl-(pentapeptide) pyrophosphoryl-undecaprenol N-acetylglucosamine transferase [Gemmatimonadaceae bacterium]
MRVLFAGGGTGGHLYPGLAIARALVALDASVKPFFVGARRGIERDVLPTTEFPHELLELHPLYRSQPWNNWKTIRGASQAWGRLGAIARDERPAVVVGTGGYAAGLALGYAATHGIPLCLQEQNSHPGLTTRFFSRYAREVYLGYPEAETLLPKRGAVYVDSGNPIQPPPATRPDRGAARQAWGFPRDGGPVLLIYGGSQGSRAMNQVVDAWVARGVPEGLHVIWATGKGTYEEFASRDGAGGGRVRVRAYLAPIADAYAASDFAVTRAGAMTTAELFAWGIPPVLVPLPTAAADHQTANAVTLTQAGAALHVPQREFTPDRLSAVVGDLLANPERLRAMTAAGAARARPDAAKEIAARVLAVAKGGARR